MKRYLIETSVENAEGSQCWYVDASSESEALEKYREGGCDLYSSDVDVTSLGEPEISGETTLDDFGDFAEKPAQPLQQVLTAAVIYEAVKHGDAKHQEWLRHALENIFAGRPVLQEATAPLAEQPAQRKPLTDEETKVLWHKARFCIGSNRWTVFKKLIEAAHGIKE